VLILGDSWSRGRNQIRRRCKQVGSSTVWQIQEYAKRAQNSFNRLSQGKRLSSLGLVLVLSALLAIGRLGGSVSGLQRCCITSGLAGLGALVGGGMVAGTDCWSFAMLPQVHSGA